MNRISIEPTFAAWRRAARELLRQGVEPERIQWIECEANDLPAPPDSEVHFATGSVVPVGSASSATSGTSGTSGSFTNFSGSTGSATPASPPSTTPAISRELLAGLKTAACFRAPDRWSLLYRILWRWTRGERHVLDPQDRDGALLDQRIRSVNQATADLLSLTLFRRRDPLMGAPEFVGWHEPHHDLLERAAERFADQMGDSTWMLATPQGAVFWNGMLLRIRPPSTEDSGRAALSSAGSYQQNPPTLPPGALAGEATTSEPTEALWLAYYASIFNGASAPVPLRYWRTPAAGPPLPAQLARERSRLGAQSGIVAVPAVPPVEDSALTPPLREPTGPLPTCRRCALWRNAKQAVAGAGAPQAAIMAVGEQPGEYENQHGEPFTGPAGQLLDAVLARAGLERAALYLTYAVKHYKWETIDHERVHRLPARREVEACRYWLEKELTGVAPRVVVALGPTALQALTGPHVCLSEYLGQTIHHDGRLIVPTWHPSYALKMADARLRADVVAGIVAAFARAAKLSRAGT